MSYQSNRNWSDQYIPAIKQIVGPCLIETSSFDVDTKQATDLIIMRARDMMIACRVRREGYLDKYGYDMTLRAKLESGVETELSKVTNGWADCMFYAHADNGTNPRFSRWFLIDLHAWRAAMIRDKKAIRQGMTSNGDGTHFAWFDLRTFPPAPSIIIASSEPLPYLPYIERPEKQTSEHLIPQMV